MNSLYQTISDGGKKATAANKRDNKYGFACSLKHFKSLHPFVMVDS